MTNRQDWGHKETERRLSQLEQRIEKLYRQAARELEETIADYFEKFHKRDEEMKRLVEAEKVTEEHYRQWRLNQMGRGERFQHLRQELAHRMTHANEIAVSYVNDATPGIYTINHNYAAYTIEQVTGDIGFTLLDEQTVKRLLKEEPELMPYYPPERALQRGIDLVWGKRQITASVTSSILQGKSLKGIADALQQRIDTMNRTSAIRTARTAVTGVENAGRMDSYYAAEKMGIRIKKEWLATLDNRTRHSHAMLDGQRVNNNEKFSNGCRFPGDPQGPAHEVYNCRCTLVAAVDGVDTSGAQRRARDPVTGRNEIISNMTYQEWYDAKEKQHGKASIDTARMKVEWESVDRKQFGEYKAILRGNAPKTFAEFQDLKYNSGEWEAFKSYKKAIQTGELTPLADFNLYQRTSQEIDKKLVGLTTSNGIKITGKSNHFIARTVGSTEQRRSGVSVDHSFEVLTSMDATVLPERTSPGGKVSQRFIFNGVEISINTGTGNLIQVNPFSRGKEKKS